MTRLRLSVLAAALGALMAPLAAAPKLSNTPATVTLADEVGAVSGRIHSDGGGPYLNGQGCVQSWFALPKGNFFLRTVTSAPPCGDTVSLRAIVVDLNDRIWPSACFGPETVTDRYGNTLDLCGSNLVPDVRMVADRLFTANATALTVPFSLQPDFRYTAFELDFVETLTVAGTGTTRTMTAGADAIAGLWQISGRTKTLLGHYRVPLSATVTAQ